jgi:predicted Fe-S protein YdhL (DUF1289 family)
LAQEKEMSANKSTQSAEVASPCINICKINERSGLCDGCWRTLDEIIVWSKASNNDKTHILQKVEQRKHDQFNDLT